MTNKFDLIERLFENDLCGGDSLQVDLRWNGVQNHHAVGAQLALHTSAGVFRRDVRASGGCLLYTSFAQHDNINASFYTGMC